MIIHTPKHIILAIYERRKEAEAEEDNL